LATWMPKLWLRCHRWRSLNVDDRFYWLHWNPVSSVRERTVINRWSPALEWCPRETRAEYAKQVESFLRDHPFRSENRWASPVFSAYVAAMRSCEHCRGND
jgi:hypothetical protein